MNRDELVSCARGAFVFQAEEAAGQMSANYVSIAPLTALAIQEQALREAADMLASRIATGARTAAEKIEGMNLQPA